MRHGTVPRASWQLLRFGGAALLIATGAIHLDLYLTGYQTIPTIGWLFLLQVISSWVLAIAVIVTPRRLISAAGAGVVVSTLVGYLVSLRVGLLGFREVRTTAGVAAGVIEIAAFVALVAFASRPERRIVRRSSPLFRRGPNVSQRVVALVGRWVGGVVALLAALSLGLLVPSANAVSTNSGGSRAVVNVTAIKGTAVLTNARGYTLYWFAPDSSATSRCYGTCAAYWPPVLGTPSPTSGVAGSFATLKRSNGKEQVTYNGHPLYTYVGDSAPGQASGNNIRLNGGWWYEMKVSK
jgi:predicted lipoprotein with Yx(FWY)xxD motif